MKVHVKSIKVNQKAVRTFVKAQERAVELTAYAILSDIVSRAVTPKDEGELENSGFIKKYKSFVYYIIFDTPYARRWYYNLPFIDEKGKEHKPATFQKTENPFAQDHWMDYYLDGEGKQWVMETYLKFLKQESEGVVT